ncbi:hypothetical protein [Cohaesibacter haloalkalitolerans]|uniref:hypothetical protein n=1 Tax=Cohaesibacter haloalkalitolerans TaxID=1162980 RepID=UPI0013C43A67|nr:hypothetical protein [Cohaesibacter haloalkalitolerans]
MPASIEHASAVIVDMNTFQRKLLRSILRTSGFSRVAEFDKFEFGLDEAKRTFPNFLFLDYDTAAYSELFRGRPDISKSYLTEATRLIILMENATRFRVTSAIANGAHWVISRPFSTAAITRRITAMMDPDSLEASALMARTLEDNLVRQSSRMVGPELDPVSLMTIASTPSRARQEDFMGDDIYNDMFDDYDAIFQRKSQKASRPDESAGQTSDDEHFLI